MDNNKYSMSDELISTSNSLTGVERKLAGFNCRILVLFFGAITATCVPTKAENSCQIFGGNPEVQNSQRPTTDSQDQFGLNNLFTNFRTSETMALDVRVEQHLASMMANLGPLQKTYFIEGIRKANFSPDIPYAGRFGIKRGIRLNAFAGPILASRITLIHEAYHLKDVILQLVPPTQTTDGLLHKLFSSWLKPPPPPERKWVTFTEAFAYGGEFDFMTELLHDPSFDYEGLKQTLRKVGASGPHDDQMQNPDLKYNDKVAIDEGDLTSTFIRDPGYFYSFSGDRDVIGRYLSTRLSHKMLGQLTKVQKMTREQYVAGRLAENSMDGTDKASIDDFFRTP